MSKTLEVGRPLVSIVMCTYNGAKYLEEQVASIIGQTYDNTELVVVDDASTDNTWNLLQEWQSKYPDKIRIYQNEKNLGLNANFCKAIDLAKGTFIAISDQDDIWLEDKIDILLQAFTSDDTILAYTTSASISNGKLLQGNPNEKNKLFSGHDTRKVVMYPTAAGHDMMFRAVDGLKPLCIPAIIPIYDWWIFIKTTCLGNVVSIEHTGVKHRLHDSNAYYNETHNDGVGIANTVRIFNGIASLPDLRASDARWVRNTAAQFERHGETHKGRFDLKLFWYVWRNRNIIFYHVGRRSWLRTQAAVFKKCVEMAKW